MALDQGSERDGGSFGYVLDQQHRVGISYGNGADRAGVSTCVESIDGRPGGGFEWYFCGLEARNSHRHGEDVAAPEIEREAATERLDLHPALRTEALVADELGDATRTVAAGPDLGAVLIEDAVAEIHLGISGRLDQQHLIATHAAVTV